MSNQPDKMLSLSTTREDTLRKRLLTIAFAIGGAILVAACMVDLDTLFFGNEDPAVQSIEEDTRDDVERVFGRKY